VIEEVLREHSHSTYKALRSPASLASLGKLERLIGTKLPQSLASSLRIHDGMQEGSDLVTYYSLLPVAKTIEWWRIEMEFPWDRPGPRFEDRKKIKGDLRWRPRWVPLAVDAGGNLLATDLDPGPAGTRSQVLAWHNSGSPAPKVIAASYSQWLDAIAEELSSRRFTVDEWGGIVFRKRLT
jgi:cell wall assembly regulator SMI1